MMTAWRTLCDVLHYWLGRIPRLHRRLRGPTPPTYRQSGYEIDQATMDRLLGPKTGEQMSYWVLELKHMKNPQLGWVPWAILKGGHIRDHLKLVECLPAQVAGIEDGRIRPIDVTEGQRLESGGITVWGKH